MNKTYKYIFICLILLQITLIGQISPVGFSYKPVEGKKIGIWPSESYWTIEDYQSFRDNWGFAFAFVKAFENSEPALSRYHSRAIEAGYQSEDIMIQILDTTYLSIATNLETGYYYLDEPVEHNCSGEPSSQWVSHIYRPTELDSIKQFIHNNQPEAEFVIGGYKRCSHFRIAGEIADKVMYSSYENWNEFSLWSCSVNLGWGEEVESGWENIFSNDIQSESWEDMTNIFGDKHKMAWVDGRGDEYDELFEAANRLRLETVWFYGSSGMDTTTIAQFCESAYKYGWLEKIDSTEINAPSGLVSTQTDSGFVKLSWQDNSGEETGFIIERSVNTDTSFAVIDSVLSNITGYVDKQVEPLRSYYYRAKAYDSLNESAYSDTTSITISVDSIKAPSNLNYLLTDRTVELTWSDNSPNESGFIIEQSIDFNNEFSVIDTTATNSTSFSVNDLWPGRHYHFRIKAFSRFIESSYSNPVQVYLPFETIISPSNLNAEISDSAVQLSWRDNSDNELGFAVERKLASQAVFLIIDSTNTNRTFYSDYNIELGKTYIYRVIAFNVDTTSVYSDSITVTVLVTDRSEKSNQFDYKIFQNYPNPFNPSTTIEYEVKSKSSIVISIYNTIGQIVYRHSRNNLSAGRHSFTWFSEQLPSGIYILRFTARSENNIYSSNRKMILLR